VAHITGKVTRQLPALPAGNLYGLQERCLAVESLLLVARELARARSELSGLLPPSEAHALDLFYTRAVGSAEDLRDHVLRAGERLSDFAAV